MAAPEPVPVGSTLLVRAHLFQPDPVTGAPVPVDPGTLQLKTLSPSGVVRFTTAVRQSTGNLTCQIVADEVGRWHAKWISDPDTGPAPGLRDFTFDVYGTAL